MKEARTPICPPPLLQPGPFTRRGGGEREAPCLARSSRDEGVKACSEHVKRPNREDVARHGASRLTAGGS